MAATAWAYRYEFLRSEPNGNPTARIDVHVVDPALVAVQAPVHINVLLTLDATAPNQYTQQTRNAIIAAAAALQPPFTLNPADVIISAFG